MKSVVTQTTSRQFVEIWSGNRAAEGVDLPKSDVIEEDDKDVGSTHRWLGHLRPIRFGIHVGFGDKGRTERSTLPLAASALRALGGFVTATIHHPSCCWFKKGRIIDRAGSSR
jgi:hypothetical protein